MHVGDKFKQNVPETAILYQQNQKKKLRIDLK